MTNTGGWQPRPGRPRPLVLRVVSRMAIGGVQRGILATLARADRSQFDFHVLTTKKEGIWAPEVRALGVPLTHQKTLPGWDPYQIARLARVIRRIAPDLVHIHMAPMVLPAASAAWLAGVRRVVIQHHNDYARHWEAQPALLRCWEHHLTRRASAVIGVSQAVARCTERSVGMSPGSVRVVYNGLDLGKFTSAQPYDPRAEWCLPADAPLVVHVARYLGTKRIEDFIEAAALVLARWPADGATPPAFAIIGGGADDYRARYAAQIAARGLQGSVILAGSRDDVPRILPTAQVGALASEMEGFGQVILEYTATGLPVAATQLDCVAELLRPGREALLTPTRRPDLLAANIQRLLLDRAFADELSARARARLPLFDWQTAATGYETVWREVLATS